MALLLSLSLVPFYRWITWGTGRCSTFSKMTWLILSLRNWVNSQSLSIWPSCCCCSGGRLGSGGVWPPICWASLLVFPHTTLPEASSGQLPANVLKTRSLSHVGSCLGWAFLVATVICIISQSPFRGPVNPVAQPRTCPLPPPFLSCHKSAQLLTHISSPTSDICCHSGFLPCLVTSSFSPILVHALYTMSFLFLNALRTWHFLFLMLLWLPVTHQNFRFWVAFAALNGLTSLIFLMTAIHAF